MSAPQIQYPPTSSGSAPVGGTGTTNTIPRWNPGPSTLGDSGITDNGTVIGVANGTRTMTFNLVQISGNQVNTPGAGELAIQYATSKNTVIYNGSSPALFVNGTSGNVGIGTASPVTTLANTSSAIGDGANNVATAGLTWSPNAIGFAAGIWNTFGAVGNGLFVRTSDTSSSTRVFHVCAGASAVPNSLLFVRGDGNVGIGTTGPGAKLEIPFSGTAAGCRIQFASGPFNYFNATNHYFRTLGDADVMTIVSTNVGIGTTGPDSRLHVTLAGLASLRIGYAGTSVNYYDAGTHNFRDGGGNPAFTITAGATKIADLSVSGWGLKLPATPGNGNANTLDSYQEGTRVLSAGDLSGWTYVTATQYWTLVGRTVTLHTVFTGGTSSATGGATIATPPLLTPLRIAAGAAVNSSGTALGNGVCVVVSTSSTTGTVITSNAISSSAVDKVLTVTYETAGL